MTVTSLLATLRTLCYGMSSSESCFADNVQLLLEHFIAAVYSVSQKTATDISQGNGATCFRCGGLVGSLVTALLQIYC